MNWKTLLLAGALSAISPTSYSNWPVDAQSWSSPVISGALVGVNVYSRWDNPNNSSRGYRSFADDYKEPSKLTTIHWISCPEWVQKGNSVKQDLVVNTSRNSIDAVLYCRNNLWVSRQWKKQIDQVSPAWLDNSWQIQTWRWSNWWTQSLKVNNTTFATNQAVRVLFSDGKGKHEVICTNPQEVPIVWATFNTFRQNIEVKRWWTDINFWTNYAVNVLLNCNFS